MSLGWFPFSAHSGGGFINGSSNQADMTEIVEKTGVVGVSFSYRLGPLGFFSHPDVAKDSGDFGLRLCQSNGRSSARGATRPPSSDIQVARARHSANVAERLCL